MCRGSVARRHKGRKLGRGYKEASNQLAAVDERDFGFLLSIGTRKETVLSSPGRRPPGVGVLDDPGKESLINRI